MDTTPDLVAPLASFTDGRGHGLVITLIDNLNGARVNAAGFIIWPDTDKGLLASEFYYREMPEEPKRPKRRIEVSIDRVDHFGSHDVSLTATKRIPQSTGETLLGQSLQQALTRLQGGAKPQRLPVDRFEAALAG